MYVTLITSLDAVILFEMLLFIALEPNMETTGRLHKKFEYSNS